MFCCSFASRYLKLFAKEQKENQRVFTFFTYDITFFTNMPVLTQKSFKFGPFG